ncbi:MAG: hypothetical protein HY240_11375 [Actinobacteria bacterium]|nr:hypothetical protein [Actinomycetota bacterium]
MSPEAEWCGQCFSRLSKDEGGATEQAAAVVAETVGAVAQDPTEPPAIAAGEGTVLKVATWPCPVCEARNPIEIDACAVCGTPFAALLKQDEAPPKVDPRDAFRRSLAFPGLGHMAIGRGGDGLARGVLFVMTFGLAVVAAASGVSTPAVATMALVFGGIGVLVYFGTAFEAARMARGLPAVLSSRAILWIVVGVLLGSVMILALLVVSAARSVPSP